MAAKTREQHSQQMVEMPQPLTMSAEPMKLPTEWWKRESTCRKLSHWFRHHIVGVLVVWRSGDFSGHEVFTGFLYRHQGVPLWLSAGHVVREIQSLLTRPNLEIVRVAWLDFTDTVLANTIPADPSDFARRGFQIEENGIDVGFVVFRPLFADAVSSGKPSPFFDESQVVLLDQAPKIEGAMLVGIPKELHRLRKETLESGRTDYRLDFDLVCLPARCDTADDDDQESPIEDRVAIKGELLPFKDTLGKGVADIDFMSGGPLVAFWRDSNDQIRYGLYGIQRGWKKKSRAIRAVRMDVALHVIQECFRRAAAVDLGGE